MNNHLIWWIILDTNHKASTKKILFVLKNYFICLKYILGIIYNTNDQIYIYFLNELKKKRETKNWEITRNHFIGRNFKEKWLQGGQKRHKKPEKS